MSSAECVKFNGTSPVVTLEPLRRFNCEEGSYNPLASLFLEPGHTVVQHLFSRGADRYVLFMWHMQRTVLEAQGLAGMSLSCFGSLISRHFGYPTIASFGVIYFFFACICAGTHRRSLVAECNWCFCA